MNPYILSNNPYLPSVSAWPLDCNLNLTQTACRTAGRNPFPTINWVPELVTIIEVKIKKPGGKPLTGFENFKSF
jgi:hypothetical protein